MTLGKLPGLVPSQVPHVSPVMTEKKKVCEGRLNENAWGRPPCPPFRIASLKQQQPWGLGRQRRLTSSRATSRAEPEAAGWRSLSKVGTAVACSRGYEVVRFRQVPNTGLTSRRPLHKCQALGRTIRSPCKGQGLEQSVHRRALQVGKNVGPA